MRRLCIAKLEFESSLAMEYSALPNMVPMGMAKSVMSLYIDPTDPERLKTGGIDWEYEFLNEKDGEDGGESIGLWFDGKKVTDYDGVMTLPFHASLLLKAAGYDTEEVDCYDFNGNPT